MQSNSESFTTGSVLYRKGKNMNTVNNDSYVMFLQAIAIFIVYLVPALFVIGIIMNSMKKIINFESVKKEKVLGCSIVRINSMPTNMLLVTTLKEVYFLSIKDNYKLCKSTEKLEKVTTNFDKDDVEFLIKLDNSEIKQFLFNYKFANSLTIDPFYINIEIIK